MTRVVNTTLAGLKMVALAGPVVVVMGGIGASLLTLATSAAENHNDKMLTLGAVLVILAFVEWILARRFHVHEAVERTDRAALVQSIAAQGQANLDRAMNQIESVGARYDLVHAELKEMLELQREIVPRIKALEIHVERLEKDVGELRDWRARIGGRLGELR